MKTMTGLSKFPSVVVLLLTLSLVFATAHVAVCDEGATDEITINATINQQLVFEVHRGKSVVLVTNPVDHTSATGESTFNVKTNVGFYAITAASGAFEVDGTDYDLIDQQNFILKSAAPDSGEPTSGWVAPSESTTILSGESGYTNGEITTVHYKLKVDFTVPHGTAETTIVYTALPTT